MIINGPCSKFPLWGDLEGLAKELDEESGFYYYGARYYDPRGFFISMDPLMDKYPWISPYAYCGNNPLNRIDPTGMIWDESQLTASQKAEWQKNVQNVCNDSPLFKAMYDQLDKSTTIYSVNVGATADGVPGQFNASNNAITFLDEGRIGDFSTMSEEMFHAYQKDNANLYESGKAFNMEFEAKVAKRLMQYEKMLPTTIDANTKGFMDFMENEYGIYGVPIKSQVSSPLFNTEYMKGAEDFKNWNINNNYGNLHYKTKTEQSPKSLLRLYGK